MPAIKAVVFDSNETLLDLSALDPLFERAFGDANVRKQWFKQVLALFLTLTVIDEYRPFDAVTDSALTMVAEQFGVADGSRELASKDRAAIHAQILELPPHPDVIAALERLRAREVRLAVLTNSTQKSVTAQMKHAGLTRYFDALLSADAVERYKPARRAYAHAAKSLGVELGEIRMVAAHGWDVSGALAAGCKAAFVRRPEKSLDPRGAHPDVIAGGLIEAAEMIIDVDC